MRDTNPRQVELIRFKTNLEYQQIMKTPFLSSPIGAAVGLFGAKAIGLTGFWETMGLVLLSMILAFFIVKKASEKASQ